MRERLARDFKAERVEEDRPDYGVKTDDLLPYEMHISRPVALELGGIVQITDRGDVVGEGVDPHVDDMTAVEGHGDAPCKRGAADGDVLEA